MIGPVVKTATGEPERSRLRREAQLLLRARHPGVVTISAFTDQDGSTRLTIAAVNGCTLAEAPPRTPLDALRFTAALARTIADLHQLGIAHRLLRADHVLSTVDGRPVLSEFGDATANADDDDRRADAEALRDLVGLIASATTPAPRDSRATAALRSIAADLRNSPVPMSPAVLAARAGRAASRRNPKFGRRRAQPRRHRVAAFALGPAIVLIAVVLMSRHAGEAPAPASIATTSATTATHPATPATEATPTRVEVGGASFDVGKAGDQVVVADWHCDGEPSAALLRPTTGEVFVFASLPAEGETLTARRVATVPGAVSIDDDKIDAPCPPLVVRRTDGSRQPLGDR